MIPVLTSTQVKLTDAETIKKQGLQTGELMEKAGILCAGYIMQHFPTWKKFIVFCGNGNNGGDGLVVARLLNDGELNVRVYLVQTGKEASPDFSLNLERLEKTGVTIVHLSEKNQLPAIKNDEMVIDALFGIGLTRPIEGMALDAVKHINQNSSCVISIDLPSGLNADACSAKDGEGIVKANFTLTIGAPKICLFMPENAAYVGSYALLDIGLDKEFINELKPEFYLPEKKEIGQYLPARDKFSHKGDFGHALLVAGSLGKTGAAVLASRACLRAGVGLLTVQVPKSGYAVMQASVPEAMCLVDEGENFVHTAQQYDSFSAIGIGPGIGTRKETSQLLLSLLQSYKKPMVLDADALNILSANKEWLNYVPGGSILTPHMKEFVRMFGQTPNDFDRLALLRASAVKYNVHIVLKGHFSVVASPKGISYINTTGNAGMATGGTGDVLTGILTSLLAQGLKPLETAIAGVYLHGLAGDNALETESMESMTAGDIVNNLGKAFKKIHALV
ncbi:MAG TPA: NAD(P)H-hydrate dehydratase [Flavobacteriales bacterium]|nr:NAD(P)H-hydrate dehydratase [Flavobacteriales bacterium]